MKIELQALEHAYPGGDKALDGVDLTLDGNARCLFRSATPLLVL